jgi:hypothetical protein
VRAIVIRIILRTRLIGTLADLEKRFFSLTLVSHTYGKANYFLSPTSPN